MSQNLVLKAKGLHTFQNSLSAVPEGSLQEALNVVIDRNDIIEPRRGFPRYGNTFLTSSDRAKQLFSYKDKILRHTGLALEFDSDNEGTFDNFTGTLAEVENGLRVKSIEANGNLYLATLNGIKKLSARTSGDFSGLALTDAGGVKALDVTAMPNYSTAGFLTPNSQVAYRIVWNINDINENLIQGAPSNRVVVENISATQSAVVDLSFAVPDDVTSTDYFYQVYRTGVFPSDPGDEMYLVFEDYVSSAQITAGIVTTTDITPEDFRRGGALLYTNPQSGEGISQANEKPPFAKDIALYKGYTFYGNTSTVHRLNLSFISVTQLISETSEITVSDGTTSQTYRFRGTTETYTLNFTGTTDANFTAGGTNPGRYLNIGTSNDERKYYIWYKKGSEIDPLISGGLGVMVDISTATTPTQLRDATLTAINTAISDFNLTAVGASVLEIETANNGYVTIPAIPGATDVLFENITGTFSLTSDNLGTGEDSSLSPPRVFLPRVPAGAENGPTTAQQIEQIATSLVRVINRIDPLINAFYISGFDDVPGQILLQRDTTTGSAFFVTANSSLTGSQFNPELPTSGNSIISSNEVKTNRIYYSKYQQPEAVPLVNYIDIGPKDRQIKRIIALRDSLFIFKEDGIYRLTGEASPFQISPFDFSVQVKAADSAVVLNNQIYALSTQGVVSVTDTAVSVISRPIENLLLNVTRPGFSYITKTFGVSYESDRAYHLWIITNSNDTTATQCFRYNTFTESWVRWNKSASCGIVNFSDDRMYLGAGDMNWIDRERKTLTRTDYADREFEATILTDSVNAEVIQIGSTDGIDVGDRVIQTQYLTISQYNRLLNKLDFDPQIADSNYFMLLEGVPGDNLRTKIVSLANKLDADLGVSDTDYFTQIDDYVQTITTTTIGAQTVITFASNDIKTGRYVTISGSDTTPSIDGIHEVVASSGTTITIDFTTTVVGTMGTVQTDIQNFQDVQGSYNLIINKLNNDSGVFYTNYLTSSGTVEFEAVIVDVNDQDSQLTLKFPLQFIEGVVTIFKAFQTRVIWNPQTFQDPSIYKQVREGTLLFENTNFTEASLAYGTDMSPSFEGITAPGLGDGDFGYFNFGGMNFGGIGAAIPIRTFVPLQKQRCRFMIVRFEHKIALEKFSLYGISLTFRPYSTRGYKGLK